MTALEYRIIKLEAMMEVSLSMQCQILGKLDGRQPEEIYNNVVKNIQEIYNEYTNLKDDPE